MAEGVLGPICRRANVAFHKTGKHSLASELTQQSQDFDKLLSGHRLFVGELSEYRMWWIHKRLGGPVLHIRRAVRASEQSVDVVIPKAPSADFFGSDEQFL